MAETKTCPECGAELPADAPAGICPKCLMLAGLESEQDAGSSSDVKPTTLTSGFVPPEPEDLAKHFPQLEILELLGKGGMGAVYKARQPGLDRLVAVKILPPEIGADPAFAERFTREARALAKLSHQNIVSVFDFGQADGQYYFIMEYVDGTNLRHLIETGGLKPEEALAIVPQICESLQFAHDEGIIHRDIKPENILVDKQGRVKIADFGLAKLLGQAPADITLTGTHQAMGTLHYMAPEQMRGAGAVDHRADIYSLGVVFYEMLTGQLPIGKFEPPSKKVQVDVRLDEVVLRALESEPERRYQRAAELKHDTERVASIPADRPSGPAASLTQEASDAHDAAARRLRNPMAALFIAGLAQLIVAVVLTAWLGVTLGRIHATPATAETSGEIDATGNGMTVTVDPHPWRPFLGSLYGLLGVNIVSTLVGLLAVVAAIWGSRLRMERFVRIACGLVCLPSPTWPFGLLAVLAAFSALGRPNVKRAFAAIAEQDDVEPRPSFLCNWSVWTSLGIGAATLAMSASLVPWFRIYIFGVAATFIGLDGWHGIVVCVAGGFASVLVAAFAVFRNSRFGQGLSALVGGLVIAAVAGYSAWEVAHPAQPQTSSTVTGDASLQEFGQGLADTFADLMVDAIQQRPSFGMYAAIVCGTLLALVGAGQLVAPLFAAARRGDALESKPRFSRKAIIGACWSPFILVALYVLVAPTSRGASGPDSPVLTAGTVDGEARTVDDSDAAAEPSRDASDVGADFSGPTWWQWAVLGTVSLLALTAPFGTTILGLISINDIRYSQGRITGLPLAVADSLLYPLLLLDGLIVCLFWFLCVVGYEVFGPGTPMSTRTEWLCIAITILLSLPTCAYIDFWIVRAAWRKATGQQNATT